tara:strand:+ start:331 stop:813 length:483 start_codon:yes stop_codon:yes gene_type:complete
MSIIPVLGINPTQTFAFGASLQPGPDSFRLGQLGAVIGETTKLYKFVQNYSLATTAEAGDVCYYIANGHKTSAITTDLSFGQEVGAGIIQTSVTALDFCWIQIRGPATLSTALTAGSDGDPLTPSGASDKTLDVAASFTDNICAIACDISDKEIICMFPY